MLYFKVFIERYMFQIFDLFSYWIMIVHFFIISKTNSPDDGFLILSDQVWHLSNLTLIKSAEYELKYENMGHELRTLNDCVSLNDLFMKLPKHCNKGKTIHTLFVRSPKSTVLVDSYQIMTGPDRRRNLVFKFRINYC